MSGPVPLAESIAFAKAVSELLGKTRGHRKQGKMSAALDALLATVSALETRARIAESAIKAAEERGEARERAEIVRLGEEQADAYAQANNMDAVRAVAALVSQINQRCKP